MALLTCSAEVDPFFFFVEFSSDRSSEVWNNQINSGKCIPPPPRPSCKRRSHPLSVDFRRTAPTDDKVVCMSCFLLLPPSRRKRWNLKRALRRVVSQSGTAPNKNYHHTHGSRSRVCSETVNIEAFYPCKQKTSDGKGARPHLDKPALSFS